MDIHFYHTLPLHREALSLQYPGTDFSYIHNLVVPSVHRHMQAASDKPYNTAISSSWSLLPISELISLLYAFFAKWFRLYIENAAGAPFRFSNCICKIWFYFFEYPCASSSIMSFTFIRRICVLLSFSSSFIVIYLIFFSVSGIITCSNAFTRLRVFSISAAIS